MKPYSRLSLLSFPILIIFCLFAACSKDNPGEAQINDVKVSGGWSGTADQFDQKFVQHGGRLNTMTGYTGTLTILDDEARKVSQETFINLMAKFLYIINPFEDGPEFLHLTKSANANSKRAF